MPAVVMRSGQVIEGGTVPAQQWGGYWRWAEGPERPTDILLYRV